MNMVISMSILRKTDAPRNKAQVIIMKATLILSTAPPGFTHLSMTWIVMNAGIRENNERISMECFPRRSLDRMTSHR